MGALAIGLAGACAVTVGCGDVEVDEPDIPLLEERSSKRMTVVPLTILRALSLLVLPITFQKGRVKDSDRHLKGADLASKHEFVLAARPHLDTPIVVFKQAHRLIETGDLCVYLGTEFED